MALWLLPFAPSLLSPFAFAAGLPSLVLLILWFIKMRAELRTGTGRRRNNATGNKSSVGTGLAGRGEGEEAVSNSKATLKEEAKAAPNPLEKKASEA